MHSKLVLTGGLVAAAFIAAACSTTSSSGLYGAPSSAPSAAPSAAPVAAPPAASGTASTCNSASCVQYWPPVLTSAAPVAGAGVNGSLLGTTARADGTTQVTYGGHPLYRFISDKKAGDATGQGVTAFGAPWYVVSPSGALVR